MAVDNLLKFNTISSKMMTRYRSTPPPSFSYKVRESIQRMRYVKQYFGLTPDGFSLTSKTSVRNFAEATGLNHPRCVSGPKKLEDLVFPNEGKWVLKPLKSTNSWGVQILLIKDGVFTNLTTGQDHDLKQVNELARQEMLARNFANIWMIEEMVEPHHISLKRPDDLKIYAFYGKAAISLHKRSIGSKAVYRWYDRSGETVDCGKYENKLLKENHFPHYYNDLIEQAEAASRQMPFPFMRIDFLLSEDSGYLGEMTPHPGGFNSFNKEWDEILGAHWEEAEAVRLADKISSRK